MEHRFQPGLERGKVRNLGIDVEYPDGTSRKFEFSVGEEIGGILFDDGLVEEFLAEIAKRGDPDWEEGIRIWGYEDSTWKERPSYLLVPRVDVNKCGPGNCPAAKTGQCVGGGQCCSSNH